MSGPRLAALVVACAASLVSAAFADGNSRICLECHETGRWQVAEHPLFVAVEGMIRPAAGLPLEDGKIGCVTCHTFHGGGEPGADPGGRFWLRRAVPGLCAACHTDAEGEWDRGHARYGDTIHGGVRPAPVDDPGAEPDTVTDGISDRCQACHGAAGAGGRAIDAGHSHPLKDYGAARAVRWEAYTPADRLDPLVRLVDGRVSCVSCHRLYGKAPTAHRLVVTDRRGALCGRCHTAFS